MTLSQTSAPSAPSLQSRQDIAVVGMSCFYPRSNSLTSYWHNILTKIDAVTEVPSSHWDWKLYYDPDPRAKDRIVSKWGGFLDDILFDPLTFGMPPNTLPFIEPHQLMLLEAVRQAIDHAGYSTKPFDREQTCAILGIGGGGASMTVNYGLRSCMPLFDSVPGMKENAAEMIKKLDPFLPEWTEDSFPGILHNVAAGRIANRFNFGGTNFAIDAACASSLAALHLGIRELECGTSNVAVVMGADTVQTPYAYMAFSKTHALSQKGKCRPFDDSADGIVLSEGIGVVILKRLEDAEKDGDKIWAVIKGMGASSDGKDKGLTAPRAEGQLRALRRAYKASGISPCDIGLVEAHGTGTVVGDRTEATALRDMFIESGAGEAACALGSVKSLIGHSKCAAGIAGMIKTVLALNHKVLPPTHVEKPNVKAGLDKGPLYLNTEPRPWIQGNGKPRRAGVSAFGFGGTNFHAVLEEYNGPNRNTVHSPMPNWPAELLVWRNNDRNSLIEDLRLAHTALESGANPNLGDWSLSLIKALPAKNNIPTFVVAATSVEDAKEKISNGLKALKLPEKNWQDPRGAWFAENPSSNHGKIAVLFPGQGSQHVNMLAQVAIAFPAVRETLDQADQFFHGKLEQSLGRYIYPPSAFTPEQEQHHKNELTRTDIAQPAIGVASLGLWELLNGQLGLKPDFFAGHSYGEYVALHAAGAITRNDLLHLSHQRGAIIHEKTASMPGAMAAIEADASRTSEILKKGLANNQAFKSVSLANLNSPTQTVISGEDAGIEAAVKLFKDQGIRAQRIPVACGFHSPLVAQAEKPLADSISSIRFSAPRKPVFSNMSAKPYPSEPNQLSAQLQKHLTSPVRFQEQIEALYEAGARIFVEVGPQGVLTSLVGQILKDRPHVAIASDSKAKSGIIQLQHLLAQLIVHGVDLNLNALLAHRSLRPFDVKQLAAQTGKPVIKPTTWLVNSVRSKPFNGPEPLLIGVTERKDNQLPLLQPKASSPVKPISGGKPAPASPAQAAPATPKAAPAVAPQTPNPAPASTRTAKPLAAPVVLNPISSAQVNPEIAKAINPGKPAVEQSNPSPTNVTVSSNSSGSLSSLNHLNSGMGIPSDEAGQVMIGFQELMGKFLDTQRSVMLSYLQGGVASNPIPVTQPKIENRTSAPAPVSPAPVARTASPAPVVNSAPKVNPQPVKVETREEKPVAVKVVSVPVATEVKETKTATPASEGPAPASKGGTKMDRDAILSLLLDLVSQRTGYPKEMLDLDLDLEADLGIDSIKRVEILSTVAESIEGLDMASGGNVEMEKLTTIRTLRGIVEFLDQTISSSNGASDDSAPALPVKQSTVTVSVNSADVVAKPASKEPREGDVMRLGVTLKAAALPEDPSLFNFAGPILVTDDGRGIAKAVADRLADNGQSTIIIRMSGENGNDTSKEGFSADLTNPEEVNSLLARIRDEAGSPAGLIHLLPLSEPLEGESDENRSRREVVSLYLLSRSLENELREHGKKGQALLLGVTGLGGRLGIGHEPLPSTFFAGQGGILGFTKCLAFEWPEVLVRAVDIDPGLSAARIADAILAEMGDLDGPIEVGVSGNRRISTLTMPAPIDAASAGAGVKLDNNSTILITGGARGITAEVAVAFANQYQSRLILVGRSPLPSDEGEDTIHLKSQAEIKGALMAQLQKAGKPVTPSQVEANYQRLLTNREIRNNMDRIRNAGSTVEYHSIDVRDEESMVSLIRLIEKQFGKIDGVIHGAGVIEDKLLKDKTPESFERVFGTKVDSSLILFRHLNPEKLQFLVLFSSIAGRYGNKGQSDYAAANEVLAKMADEYNRRWHARVVSMAWGPWGGVGMVADLEKHLVARGLKLITAEAGSRFVIDEIEHGSKDETEIVVAGGSERMGKPSRPTQTLDA